MEIYPGQQLAMLLSALLLGVALGVLWECLAALRIPLGAYQPQRRMRALYDRPLPLLGRPVSFGRQTPLGKLWRGTVVAVGDLLFCLCMAVGVVLILYRYHDGKLRIAVPVLTALGYAAWHRVAQGICAPLMAYLAYGCSACALYLAALLRLPFRVLRMPVLLLLRLLGRLKTALRYRRAKRDSKRLCAAQLAAARRGSLKDL